MKPHLSLLAAALVTLAAGPAPAGNPATDGALATRANRIVGLWDNYAYVGPCDGTPGPAQRQLLMYMTGGTFLDNSRFPPQGMPNLAGIPGIHQRSIGVGTWSYSPQAGSYTLDQRFDWYVDNVYNGYQVVHRTILLSNDGNSAEGPVTTTRYAADGSVIVELCGSASSTRI
ncbi:hypothetical protein MQC88_12630 [Luteimonas sp. 50]|uniref:Lipocalin-like protein n=1 Tax=Cognatiluteimonas sedimenti TaxID=2927791 RepID=A0ABT0A725_9GAMM|nr:hypothetical protein [Lysobacter sedimenti]MCJ0826787.1 hypothetical protein [Lysobacter sedimenti]